MSVGLRRRARALAHRWRAHRHAACGIRRRYRSSGRARERIDLLTRRTDQLARLSRWLTDGTERPTDEEISEALCRWFIQPALRLRRETYAELVSTGNL